MQAGRIERRLAAILAADAVGYSGLMEADEEGTLLSLGAHRRELVDPTIAKHGGRIVKTTGDGLLAEFASVVDAVRCAAELQKGMRGRNAELDATKRLEFRIGINVGDIVEEAGDIFGDGVNVAARLEGLAEPGGICVSDRVREFVAGKVDLAFEDLGEQILKNIARPIHVYGVRLTAPSMVGSSNQNPSLPDKPSIAVMPFQNMSGDPEQDYFAEGMAEEIITALSRLRWLFVIARNSSFAYKGRAANVKQVGRELGVHYVLEGSVRKSGERVRITGQLADAATGNQIWANRYDAELSDIFDLQDRMTESVVGAIEPSILSAEVERSARKRPESLIAYDYVLRAFPLVWSLVREQNEAAESLLEMALSIEPTYPLALSLLSWCNAQRAVYNWTDELDAARTKALRLARQAAALSRDDPLVFTILGAAHTVARDFQSAAVHLDRALELDPNSAWAWQRSAWLEVHRERPQIAIEKFERALRLSPLDPMAYVCLVGIGTAHFGAGRDEEAIVWLRKAQSQQPEAVWSLRVLVPALVHAGRKAEAAHELANLVQRFPGLTTTKVADSLPFGPRMMERIVSGLREAGLPS